MSDTLGKIAAYAAVSMVFGGLAAWAGRRKARKVLAGDAAAMASIPAINMPVPPGLSEKAVLDLDREAASAAVNSSWQTAASRYFEAGNSYPRGSLEWEYMHARGRACMKVHNQVDFKVMLCLVLAWGAAVAYFLLSDHR